MPTSKVMSCLMRAMRAPFMPVLMHIDKRVKTLLSHQSALEQRIASQEAQVTEQVSRLHCDAQAVVQSSAFVERVADELISTIQVLERGAAGNGKLISWKNTDCDLSFGNRLLAHDGPIAKAGLWFNPPVVLNLTKQGVELDQIHERIIEVPFVYRALAGVPAAGRVLDVGCSESTVALSLASLGFEVLALDQRDYVLRHPNLRVMKDDIAKWSGPEAETLDAVVCLSTLEHFGLEAYHSGTQDSDLDYWAIQQFRKWLKKGGQFILTAPYGRPAVSDFERVYGPAQLDRLLEGWHVRQRLVYARYGKTEWRQVEETAEPWPEGLRGVVLVHAEKT